MAEVVGFSSCCGLSSDWYTGYFISFGFDRCEVLLRRLLWLLGLLVVVIF